MLLKEHARIFFPYQSLEYQVSNNALMVRAVGDVPQCKSPNENPNGRLISFKFPSGHLFATTCGDLTFGYATIYFS